MVRNVDDLDFHLPSHAQDVLDGLRRLRTQPKLADVTLLVGGRELPCHRGLLALSSPYFHAMFAGDFAESFSARVELRDVEAAVVGQLLDFVYTGRLTVTQANVEALTRTAARLHFPAVQKVCGRYLQQQLDPSNCLGICEFGERQGLLGVAAKAWAFLRENFEAVAREEEFLQLSQDRLATCLASDLLQVQPEQSRLEALLRWARHDPQARAAHLPRLLGLVHLGAVPRPCVQQLLATEPLILESEACRAALSQGHDGVSVGGGEERGPSETRPVRGWGRHHSLPSPECVPVCAKREGNGDPERSCLTPARERPALGRGRPRRGRQSGRALWRRQRLSWASGEGRELSRRENHWGRWQGAQTGVVVATTCPWEAAQAITGRSFLFGLAVGLAGKAGPNNVTGQGVAETRSQQVHLPPAGLLRASLQRTSQKPSLGTKTQLWPRVGCAVANS